MLFAREIEALDTASGAAATRPAMELPSDAKWGDLRFAFVSDEVLHVSYKGQPAKRIEPDQLGMKSEKSGKATRQPDATVQYTTKPCVIVVEMRAYPKYSGS